MQCLRAVHARLQRRERVVGGRRREELLLDGRAAVHELGDRERAPPQAALLPVRKVGYLRDREHDLVLAAHDGEHGDLGAAQGVVDVRAVEEEAVVLEEARHLLRRHAREHVEPHRRLDDEPRALAAPPQRLLGPVHVRVVQDR